MCSKRCIDIWKRDGGQHKRPNVLSPRSRTPPAHPPNPPSVCRSVGLPGSLRRLRLRCDTQLSPLQRRVSARPRQSALRSCRLPESPFSQSSRLFPPHRLISERGNLPEVRRRRRSAGCRVPLERNAPGAPHSCPGQRLPGLGAAQGKDSRAGNLSGSFKPLLFLRGQEKGVAGKKVTNVRPGGRVEPVFLS